MAVCLTVLAVVSCRTDAPQQEQQVADSAALTNQTGGLRPAAGRYTLQDFARLRWLEGSWRGRPAEGAYFYERYRLLDDSTIVMQGFADSTFARATDSARITFRDGTVADEGTGSRWVATRLDSSVVVFASAKDASRGFSWALESPDRWRATLHSTDREGRPQITVYSIERVVR